MRLCPSRILLLLATTLSLFATEADRLQILNGPWMVQRDDGSVFVGLELPVDADGELVAGIHLRDAEGAVLPIPMWRQEEVRRRRRGSSQLVGFTVPLERAALGLVHIAIGSGQRLPVHLSRPPLQESAVRVLFVGNTNYPRAADMAIVQSELTGPPDVVVALGPDLEQVLGTGGWEDRVPLVVMPDANSPVLEYLTGGPPAWPWGTSWGVLGLVTAPDFEDAIHAISRNESPWQVYLAPEALWDIGTVQSAPEDGIGDLRLLIGASKWRQLPLMFAAGHAAGFVSEPLALEIDRDEQYARLAHERRLISRAEWSRARQMQREANVAMREALLRLDLIRAEEAAFLDERLRKLVDQLRSDNPYGGVTPRAGGIRYVQMTAAGGPVAGLPEPVALPFYGARLCAVHVTRAEMTFQAIALDPDERTVRLRYDAPLGVHPTAGAGWGESDPSQLLSAVSDVEGAAGDEAHRALHRLAWLPRDRLRLVASDNEILADLLDQAAEDPSMVPLRRLLGNDLRFALAWMDDRESVPAVARRDLLIRTLMRPLLLEDVHAIAALIRTTDPWVLRAWLSQMRRVDPTARQHMLKLLARRLDLQSQGTVALDRDPLLQHEVVATVLGSPHLSPTGLRPIADRMRKLPLHSLVANGPLRRFFEEYGEHAALPDR